MLLIFYHLLFISNFFSLLIKFYINIYINYIKNQNIYFFFLKVLKHNLKAKFGEMKYNHKNFFLFSIIIIY